MSVNKNTQHEILEDLQITLSGVCEPDIEGVFKDLRKAKTLDSFQDSLDELLEFTSDLHCAIQDIRDALDDARYELEEEEEDEDS